MRGKRPVRQDRRPKTTTFSAVDPRARPLKRRPARQHAIRKLRFHLSVPGPTCSGACPGPWVQGLVHLGFSLGKP